MVDPALTDTAGWSSFDFSGTGTWPELWPPVHWRADSDTRIAFRSDPGPSSQNQFGGLHGAFLAGYGENCSGLFMMHRHGKQSCVTVSLNLNYPAGARAGIMLEGELELVRETGKMMFVRLVVRQEGVAVLFGDCVLRKLLP